MIRKFLVIIGYKMASEQLCQENQVNEDETVVALEALVLIRVNNRWTVVWICFFFFKEQKLVLSEKKIWAHYDKAYNENVHDWMKFTWFGFKSLQCACLLPSKISVCVLISKDTFKEHFTWPILERKELCRETLWTLKRTLNE